MSNVLERKQEINSWIEVARKRAKSNINHKPNSVSINGVSYDNIEQASEKIRICQGHIRKFCFNPSPIYNDWIYYVEPKHLKLMIFKTSNNF